MGVLVLLAGALLASAVLAQEPDSPPTAEEGETCPEEAVRDQLDEDGKIVTTDDRLAKVAKDHSGGFGGYYFDKTVEGQVFVFMTDPSQTNAARDAFQAAYKGNRTVTQITPIKGEYAFDDLLTWFRTLDRAMLADGIYPSAGAAREIQNRIWFALEDIGQVDTILELIRSLEIPEGAVIFEEAHSELLSGEDDVQSKWRPLVGGVKFQIKFGQPVRRQCGTLSPDTKSPSRSTPPASAGIAIYSSTASNWRINPSGQGSSTTKATPAGG